MSEYPFSRCIGCLYVLWWWRLLHWIQVLRFRGLHVLHNGVTVCIEVERFLFVKRYRTHLTPLVKGLWLWVDLNRNVLLF